MRTPKKDSRVRARILSRLGFFIAFVLSADACSLFGPSEIEIYALSRVNDQPLPAQWVDVVLANGVRWGQQWNRGTLRFIEGDRFSRELEGQVLQDGVLADTVYAEKRTGTYERTDTTIILRYIESVGPYEMTLHLLENGRVLRSDVLWAGLGPVQYEYVRR